MVDDHETRERMIATIVEMQEMVEATLAFVRGMATTEPVESVQLIDFLGGLNDEISEAGGAVTLGQVPGVVMRMRRNAMRRALRNLIENALRYGRRATVLAQEDAGGVTIMVEDEGPGIPLKASNGCSIPLSGWRHLDRARREGSASACPSHGQSCWPMVERPCWQTVSRVACGRSPSSDGNAWLSSPYLTLAR